MKTLLLFHVLILFVFNGFSQTATVPSGSGTSGDPYQIATLDNLYWLTQTQSEWAAGKYHIQTADIDASSTTSWDAGSGFSPIGDLSNRFRAQYDGQSFTISNLYINRSGSEIGMFGFCHGATVANLNFVNPNVNVSLTGYYGGAVFSGGAYLATFENITITGGTLIGTGTQAYLGPLSGRIENSSIENCSSTASVSCSASGLCVGGLIGRSQATDIINCYSTGDVTAASCTRVGGFVGEIYQQSTINKNYATGNVTASGNTGGFVGSAYVCTINNCYSRGNVNASTTSGKGGFVGFCQSYPTFNYCYSTGDMTGSNSSWRGAFGGYTESGTFNGCFYDNDLVNETDVFGYEYLWVTGTPVGETTSNLKLEATFTGNGYDFFGESLNGLDEVWYVDPTINDGYPYFVPAYVWDGSTSSDWNTTSNWNNNLIPTSSSFVSIPNGLTTYPILTQNENVLQLALDGTGNITTTASFSITIGNSVSAVGGLRNSNQGYVNGNIKRWISASTSADFIEFPTGNGTLYQNYFMRYTSAPASGGTVTVSHNPAAILVASYSTLNDAGAVLTQVMDGEWTVASADGLTNDGTLSLNMETNGIWGVSDITGLHLIESSPFALNGTHATASGTIAQPVVKRTGVTGGPSGTFTIGSTNLNLLPVELINFTINCDDYRKTISWQTASESNSDYFLVEKSRDLENWVEISKIEAAGNSNTIISYSIDDLSNDGNYYRLTQVDLSGEYKVYPVQTSDCNGNNSKAYPNPAVDAFYLEYSSTTATTTDINVRNVDGKNILSKMVNTKKGSNLISINCEGWPAGMYLVYLNEKTYKISVSGN